MKVEISKHIVKIANNVKASNIVLLFNDDGSENLASYWVNVIKIKGMKKKL